MNIAAIPSTGSEREAHTPEEQEPQSGQTNTLIEATLAVTSGAIVILQDTYPLTPKVPQPTMTSRITSQINDFITRHRSPLTPQITTQAVPIPTMASRHHRTHMAPTGSTTTTATTPTTNGKLARLPPTVFTGE